MSIIDNIKRIFSHNMDDDGYLKWGDIKESSKLHDLDEASHNKIQLIYKHSTRCATSYFALKNLQSMPKESLEFTNIYIVDVISQRAISRHISQHYKVKHESPQVILVKDGQVLWNGAHGEVRTEVIFKVIDQA
jgi:bacillithiol system protein YtxJ